MTTRTICKSALAVLATMALLPASALAQELSGFSKLVTEAEILSVQGSKADYDANATAVGPTGTIYTVDADATAATTGQSIIRIVPGTPNTVGLMANQADMVAAIEAVNGTTAVTSFSPRGIGVAQNGSIIVGGFTNVGNADTLLVLTDAAPATISVLHTSVNGADSGLDGIEALTVMGNTAYVATSENNGNATLADAIVAFNVTAAGPAAVGTTIVNKAALDAAYGVPNECAANALTNDGTDLYAIISSSTTAPDVVGKITTAGVATVHITKAAVQNALAALDPLNTDVGYGAIGVDGTGTIFLANNFGPGAAPHDDTIIAVSNISAGTGTVQTISKTNLGTILGLTSGTPFVGNDSFAFDATNNRMIFSEGSQNPTGAEGIWAIDRSVSSAVEGWALFE